MDRTEEAYESVETFLLNEQNNRTYLIHTDSFPYEYWGSKGVETEKTLVPNAWEASHTINIKDWTSEEVTEFREQIELDFCEAPFIEEDPNWLGSTEEPFEIRVDFNSAPEELEIHFCLTS
jgi:hypothetical protein